MPLTEVLLVAATIIELVGGILLVLVYQARWSAAILAGFTIIATLIFYTDFTNPTAPIMFFKNLSMVGRLLMVIQYGAGNIALRLRQRH